MVKTAVQMNFLKVSFWCQLGPLFLLGALNIALFRAFSFEALLLLTGFIGTVVIRHFEKKGFISFLLFLGFLCVTLFYFQAPSLYILLFAGALAWSGLLTLLGMREVSAMLLAQDEQLHTAEHFRLEWEKKWHEEHSQAIRWEMECSRLQAELAEFRKEKTAEHHDIVPQEEPVVEDKQLEQQLWDKSQALNETRRELFQVESAFFALAKESEEKTIDMLEEDLRLVPLLKSMEQEVCDKEEEIQALQECISSLSTPKKIVRKSKPKKKLDEGIFPLLERINTATASESPPRSL